MAHRMIEFTIHHDLAMRTFPCVNKPRLNSFHGSSAATINGRHGNFVQRICKAEADAPAAVWERGSTPAPNRPCIVVGQFKMALFILVQILAEQRVFFFVRFNLF